MSQVYVFYSNYINKTILGVGPLVQGGSLYLLDVPFEVKICLIGPGGFHPFPYLTGGLIMNAPPGVYLAGFSINNSPVFQWMHFEISESEGSKAVYLKFERQKFVPVLFASDQFTINTEEAGNGQFLLEHRGHRVGRDRGRTVFERGHTYKNIPLVGHGLYILRDEAGGFFEIGGGSTIIIEPPDVWTREEFHNLE